MPRVKERIKPPPAPRLHDCAIPGCIEAGEHRAPLSRSAPGQYQWLCLEHVKAFNKSWDYFKDMAQHEVEAFQRDASFGHRPTWKMNEADKLSMQALHDALGRFIGHGGVPMPDYTPPIDAKDRKALDELEMRHPASKDEVKAQYKTLVKLYHPDRNPDNKKAEERFKRITIAYNHLMKGYCASI